MWLLIHAGIKVNHVSKSGHWNKPEQNFSGNKIVSLPCIVPLICPVKYVDPCSAEPEYIDLMFVLLDVGLTLLVIVVPGLIAMTTIVVIMHRLF